MPHLLAIQDALMQIQCVAVGFDRSNEQYLTKLTSSSDEDGILDFSDNYDTRIGKVNFRGCCTLWDKKLHMISYLAELAYDLLLDPLCNVSKNPGFETPLGVFLRVE